MTRLAHAAIGCVALLLAVPLLVAPLHGQKRGTPRTPWGDPDLQGDWTSVDMLGVPLQRPIELGERRTLTDEEFAKLQQQARQRAGTATDDAISIGASTAHWYDNGRPQRQTSLIVDPPNGRFPAMTAEGAKKLGLRPDETRAPMSSPADATTLTRCITRGGWLWLLPIGSNNAMHILEAPGVVVIRHELVHEARVVLVDGRPHVGAGVRGYMGDSRGHWEGDTLIVETTNFNNKNTLPNMSTDARLIERFSRLGDATLRYEATLDDPRLLARPFTVSVPFRFDPGYQLYEYACHEGNERSMRSMLTAARLVDP